MKTLTQTKTANAEQVDAIVFTDQVDVRVLAASTAETHTIPTGAKTVFFSATDNFYVSAFETATVPSVDVTDGTGSELNPLQRSVVGITSISIIAPATTVVTMSFYS